MCTCICVELEIGPRATMALMFSASSKSTVYGDSKSPVVDVSGMINRFPSVLQTRFTPLAK